MKKVRFDPRDYGKWTVEQKKWWDAWSKRARTAKDKLPSKPPREFQGQIWSDLKAWLLKNFFNGKCAYCEVNVSAGFFGEGEHFRPKSGVRVRNGGRLAPVKKGAAAHGGYYWLAYDPTNLLPSCELCNNGKSNQFPVGGTHVFAPPPPGTDIDAAEEPLLVHPCRDDPARYLKFGVAGTVAALNEKGQRTIEVFGLDRSELAEARKARQEEARTGLAIALTNLILHSMPIKTSMEPYTGEKAQFSIAVSDYLRSQEKAIADALQTRA